jgi:hypothetical protein
MLLIVLLPGKTSGATNDEIQFVLNERIGISTSCSMYDPNKISGPYVHTAISKIGRQQQQRQTDRQPPVTAGTNNNNKQRKRIRIEEEDGDHDDDNKQEEYKKKLTKKDSLYVFIGSSYGPL